MAGYFRPDHQSLVVGYSCAVNIHLKSRVRANTRENLEERYACAKEYLSRCCFVPLRVVNGCYGLLAVVDVLFCSSCLTYYLLRAARISPTWFAIYRRPGS